MDPGKLEKDASKKDNEEQIRTENKYKKSNVLNQQSQTAECTNKENDILVFSQKQRKVQNNKDKHVYPVKKIRDTTETFDDILDMVGSGGRFQLLLVIITSWMTVSRSMEAFSLAFKIDVPEHWCTRSASNLIPVDFHLNATSFQQQRCTAVLTKSANATTSYASTKATRLAEAQAEECIQWNYNTNRYTSTAVTDFDLVCGRSYLRSTAISVHMLSINIGALLAGVVSERYGRKRMGLIGCVLYVLTSPLVAAAPNLPVFLLLLVVSGVCLSTIYCCLFTLCVEMVGSEYRSAAGMFWAAPWALGTMLTGLGGWLLRDWRQLQLLSPALLLPLLVAIPLLLPESARWLSLHGKYDEALAALNWISRINSRQINDDTLRVHLELLHPPKTMHKSLSVFHELRLLFGSCPILGYILATLWTWLAVNVVYFGISFHMAQLAPNAYLATFLGGVIDLPVLLVTPLINKLGRRPVMVASFLISAITVLLIPVVTSGWPATTLSLCGKLAIAVAYNLEYLYLEEYTPTEVRNSALGLGIVLQGVGGALSPLVVYGVGALHPAAPSVLLSAAAAAAAAVTYTLLPETVGQPLPATVAELRSQRRWCQRAAKEMEQQAAAV